MEITKKKAKVLLLVVENREKIYLEFAKFLLQMVYWPDIGIKFWDRPGGRVPVWKMRQEMIEQALEKVDFEYILFLDTDVIPTAGFLDKMISLNKDIVCGYYVDSNGEPINRKDGKPYLGKGVEEVDVMSMGFSLIRKEVLEKVKYPQPDPITKVDGDVEFCKDLKKAGYKLFCDFELKGTHIFTNYF